MPKPRKVLSPAIETILAGYQRARSGTVFGRKHHLWADFDSLAEGLRTALAVTRFSHNVVKWSVGQGRWATVPWIALLDSRETTRTSSGVYIIYLFRADMTGLYLTLNQGTSQFMTGYQVAGAAQLRRRAEKLRGRAASLEDVDFSLDRKIDLRSDVGLVRGYKEATVAYKLYERGAVPADSLLLEDLERVLEVYDGIVPSERILGTIAAPKW